MIGVLALHAVLLAIVAVRGRQLGRRSFLIGSVGPAAGLVWALIRLPTVRTDGPIATRLNWVPGLDLTLDFTIDAFSLLMVIVIAGIGLVIMLYAYSYFSEAPSLGRFAATFIGFAASMLGLVAADNVLLLFVFWELTSITSYMLIGYEDDKASARSAALQALLVTGTGGLMLLAGLVLIGQAADTYSLSAILADPPSGTVIGIGLALILVGAFTKSAQVPFHFWLPGAMTAPTPVSAYLHSATMVKAGVYLIARLAPVFAVIGFWRPVVVGVGLATMLLGGYRAMREHDLKLLLAFGTVSQLGFMVALFGLGRPEATFAGVAILFAHALFKAALFMVVGIVDHGAHTRDLRRLDRLWRVMPGTAVAAGLAAASMAGVPALLGFVAKEVALDGLLESGDGLVLAGIALGSVFTVAYSIRFVIGAFGPAGDPEQEPVEIRDVHPPALAFLAPAAGLVVLTGLWGLAPSSVAGLLESAAASLDAGHHELALKAWPGIGVATGISGAILLAGLGLYLGRRVIGWLGTFTQRVPDMVRLYGRSLVWLNRLADRITGVVQPGSLPFYAGAILLTALAAPTWSLLRGRESLPLGPLAESPVQVFVAAIVVAAAFGIVFAPRRVGAVLFLGGVGYGVAILFVIQGAPDLALTQMLIETMSLVVFIMVLRYLPARFSRTMWRSQRLLRVAIASAFGLFVTVFTLVAASERTVTPVSTEMIERSLPEGGGRNVVNVILTDFRSFDTLGEITVLVVAALGVLALVRAPIITKREEEGARE